MMSSEKAGSPRGAGLSTSRWALRTAVSVVGAFIVAAILGVVIALQGENPMFDTNQRIWYGLAIGLFAALMIAVPGVVLGALLSLVLPARIVTPIAWIVCPLGWSATVIGSGSPPNDLALLVVLLLGAVFAVNGLGSVLGWLVVRPKRALDPARSTE